MITSDIVPFQWAVDDAKINLGLEQENGDWDAKISYFIVRFIADKKLPMSVIKENEILPVCDNTVKLPKGLTRVLKLRIPCTDVQNNIVWITYADRDFYGSCWDNNWCSIGTTYFEQNGYLYFNNLPQFNELELSWMGVNKEDNGDWIVYDCYTTILGYHAAYRCGLLNKARWNAFNDFKFECVTQLNALLSEKGYKDFMNNRGNISAMIRSPYYDTSPYQRC